MATRGIDISRYNGTCDFVKAKQNGVDFVIIKAGSGASGEDPCWVKHYNGAKKAGLGVGAYWYCYATTVAEAIEEAKMFLHSLEGMQFDYPVYLDLEDNKYQGGLSTQLRTDIAMAFCDTVERAGYYVGVYSMMSWFNSKFDMNRLKRFSLWIARWRDASQGHGYTGLGTVGMWQYTNQGHFNGIAETSEGGVDANIAYIDFPRIIKQYGLNNYPKTTTTAPVKPQPQQQSTVISEADKMINKMRAWLGKSEANGQHKDIIDIYNNHKPLPQGYAVKYTDEWCATTISSCAIECGLVDKIGKECSVQRFIDIFINKGIWIEDGSIIPLPGDIICFNWDDSTQPNDGWADHIGLVETVTGNVMSILEGNNDEAVKRRTMQVANGYIRGYARPKYLITKQDLKPSPKPVEPIKQAEKVVYDLVTYASKSDMNIAAMIEDDLDIPTMSVTNYEKVKDRYKNVIHVGANPPSKVSLHLMGGNRDVVRDKVLEFIKENKKIG